MECIIMKVCWNVMFQQSLRGKLPICGTRDFKEFKNFSPLLIISFINIFYEILIAYFIGVLFVSDLIFMKTNPPVNLQWQLPLVCFQITFHFTLSWIYDCIWQPNPTAVIGEIIDVYITPNVLRFLLLGCLKNNVGFLTLNF